MRACLPTRPADDLDGQLMFAMYRHHLGKFSAPAIDHLTKQATRDCRWFPTINECLEIIADYRRDDEHLLARGMASQIFYREDKHRDAEERAAKLAAESSDLSA